MSKIQEADFQRIQNNDYFVNTSVIFSSTFDIVVM